MKARPSLFLKTLAWFFVSMAGLGVALVGLFSVQLRIEPNSLLGGAYGHRLYILAAQLSRGLHGLPVESWDLSLKTFTALYRIDLLIIRPDGTRIAGADLPVPGKVIRRLTEVGRHMPPLGMPPGEHPRPPAPPEMDRGHPGPPTPSFVARTSNPTRYWVGVPIFLTPDFRQPPAPLVLLAASDSVFGHGMFFEPEPWVLLALAIVALAALLWLPFVRHLTRPIARLTDAAGQIAQGRFDVRVHESRNDEIGVLARSVNEMAVRLDEYLLGQRRFLGDVAHELASPLARLQLGLAILERQRPDDEKLQGVIQEARRLADLVNEVLSFSRAAVNQSRVRLGPVPLAPVIARVLERECHDGATVEVKVENDFVVLADAELLARALANLVRNACRHAGRDGPITVAAARHHDEIQLEVRDSGPGVPAEMSPHLFEPFYRPEPSRDRATGGVGLGLSIVKTCVEACRGRVTARNVEPHGFAVTITLPIVD